MELLALAYTSHPAPDTTTGFTALSLRVGEAADGTLGRWEVFSGTARTWSPLLTLPAYAAARRAPERRESRRPTTQRRRGRRP
jgi:hypothetical protein